MDRRPPPKRRLKGLGWAALLVALTAVVIFLGYNTFYVAQSH